MDIVLGIFYTLLFGYILGTIIDKLGLPKLLGYLLAGIVIGKSGFNLLSTEFLSYSGQITSFALVVILIKAGLGIDKKTITKVGFRAVLLGFIPNLLEGLTVSTLAYFVLGLNPLASGMLGFIISAVSPAVVIPSMVKIKDKGYGVDKGISVMNLAATSIDDVISLTIFTSLLSLYISNSTSINISKIVVTIPLTIVWGIVVGIIIGYILSKLLKHNNVKFMSLIFTVIILLVAFLIKIFGHYIYISEMITIMTMSFVLIHHNNDVGTTITTNVNKIWSVAQIFLFVIIGALVNINNITTIGLFAIIIIAIGLIARTTGVYLSLIKSDFNIKERLFCAFSNVPKATVQATLGAIPLAYGVDGGNTILSMSVIAILVTAPIGLVLIEKSAPRLLQKQ